MNENMEIDIEKAFSKSVSKFIDLKNEDPTLADPHSYVEMEFYSKVFSGKLYFWANDDFLISSCPIELSSDLELRDYSFEFLNILMGGFKYQLLKEGVELSFC